MTGLGLLEGKPIGQWIAETVGWLDGPGSIDDVIRVIASKAETPLAQITDPVLRRHTFVVATMIGTQTRLSLVSNFEGFVRGQIQRTATANVMLTVTSIRPKSPQLFVTGAADAVAASEREQLELMLKSNAEDAAIQERLSEVNAEASRRTRTVSAGCYVASLHATGRGSSRPFLTDDQKGDFIPPEFEDQLRRMGLRLNPQIGPDGKPLPIRMVGSSSAMSGGSPQYFREQFKLQPHSAELWNNYGVHLVGKGKPDEAVAAFERAIELDHMYVTAIANLAKQQWLHQRDLSEADRLYTEAVRVAEPSVPAWILSDFAVFCDEALDEPQRAFGLHTRAVEDKEYALAKARMAYFLLRHGQETERANPLIAEALNKQPDNHDVVLLVGQAHWFYRGDREAGRARVEKACTLNPTQAGTLRLAGDMCLTLGMALVPAITTARR